MIRLRELRQQRNMTQLEVAESLGVSRVTITKYETGDREPDLKTAQRLAELFGVSIDYLVGASDDDPGPAPSTDEDEPIRFAALSGPEVDPDTGTVKISEALQRDLDRIQAEVDRLKKQGK